MARLYIFVSGLVLGSSIALGADSGDSQATYLRAEGQLEAQRTNEALALFRQCGSNGMLRAQQRLAQMLLGQQASRDEALHWMMQACRQGDRQMQGRLVAELATNDPHDYFVECWPWLKELAATGDVPLKFEAGRWAFFGLGGECELGIAYTSLSQANAAESFRRQTPQCPFLLGYLVENGFGTEQNYTAAAELYWQAATAGWPPALHRLALLLEHGQGIAQNTKAAEALYLRGAELGVPEAAYQLGLLAKQREADPDAYKKAFEYFLQAATNDLSIAQAKVGLARQEDWLRTGTDRVEALAWYQVSAGKGHRGARIRAENLERALSKEQLSAARSKVAEIKAQIRQAMPKARPGENLVPEELLKQESNLLRAAGTAPRGRPRNLSEARLAQHASTNETATSRDDVHSGLLKEYLADLKSRVLDLANDRWRGAVQKGTLRQPAPTQDLELILSFRLLSNGRVEDIELVETNTDDQISDFFMTALKDCGPTVRWIPRLRSELTEDYQDLLLSFGSKSMLRTSQ